MADLEQCLKTAMEKAAAARGKSEAGGAKPSEPAGAPESKTRRTSTEDKDENSDDVNTRLLRDYLNFKASVRPTLASKQVVFLLKSNAQAAAFAAMIEEYVSQKPEITEEMRKNRNFPKHPLNMRKDTFAFASLLVFLTPIITEQAAKDANDTAAKEAVKALQLLTTTPTDNIKLWVGECASRYAKPLEDRTWKWTISFTDFAPPSFLEAFLTLLKWKDPSKSVLLELARNFQTNDEQQLWGVLKSKPRKGGGKGRGGRK